MSLYPPFPDRPLVYVAGPYTNPDPVVNTRRAVLEADHLANLGVTPIVPHLSMLWHLIAPHDVDWWYEYDLAILARCDALYRLDGASAGADREVAFATDKGLPVFHWPDATAVALWAAKGWRAA